MVNINEVTLSQLVVYGDKEIRSLAIEILRRLSESGELTIGNN